MGEGRAAVTGLLTAFAKHPSSPKLSSKHPTSDHITGWAGAISPQFLPYRLRGPSPALLRSHSHISSPFSENTNICETPVRHLDIGMRRRHLYRLKKKVFGDEAAASADSIPIRVTKLGNTDVSKSLPTLTHKPGCLQHPSTSTT